MLAPLASVGKGAEEMENYVFLLMKQLRNSIVPRGRGKGSCSVFSNTFRNLESREVPDF